MARGVGATIATAVREANEARNGLAVAAALNCIEPEDLADFFHVRLDAGPDAVPVGAGLPASPGAAAGKVVLSSDAALDAGEQGIDVVLVRPETSPDDVPGMQASKGILTSRGGLVSHAAVVARGWGIPAVVGAAEVQIDGQCVTIGETVLRVGDEITIDGSTGSIYTGVLPIVGENPPAELDTLLRWADEVAAGHVQVRANADTEGDAGHARSLGAQGIGLCRTEHMFLSAERLPVMRRFILSDSPEAAAAALAELGAAQTHDFETLLEAMDGLPVTVRLLDPPLHEFLPDLTDLTARDARGELGEQERAELFAARRLHEANPMIGTRGVRLGLLRSGLYQMQVRALCTAAATLLDRGLTAHVEIMIPLVVTAEELRLARKWVTDVLDEIGHPELASDTVTVGAMIETPRAAVTAGALAEHADFFSFGTNDLTQMTFAFSRDDVEARLLPEYLAHGILPHNPFAVLDQEGVGRLLRIAADDARDHRPDIKLGACGEHAGHPASAAFMVRLGLDSVSCSPFRIPMARLGVAQALLACGRVHINDVEFGFDQEMPRAAGSEGPGFPVDEALVLHVLRLRGFVTRDGFEESIGVHPGDTLDDLIAGGLVRFMEARGMYALLPEGRDRHVEIVESFAPPAVRAGLALHYESFLALNERFKELCTRWQMKGEQPNDHSDAGYDAECIAGLRELSDDAKPVLAGFGNAVSRMGRYLSRLDEALAAVEAGRTSRFTGVMCSSYHDIWMELHEDLIVLQGIDRSAEGSF